jgi:hypothetical protein
MRIRVLRDIEGIPGTPFYRDLPGACRDEQSAFRTALWAR